MPVLEMKRGENQRLPGSQIAVAISWSGIVPLGCAAYLKGETGKSGTLASIGLPHRGIEFERTAQNEVQFIVEFSLLDECVEKIELLIWRSGRSLIDGDAFPPCLTVKAADDPLCTFTLPSDMTNKIVAIFAEFYRRNKAWKVRAVGDGFDENMTRLATHMGLPESQLEHALASAAAKPVKQTPAPDVITRREETVLPDAACAPPVAAPPVARPAPRRSEATDAPVLSESITAPFLFSLAGWELGGSGVVPGFTIPSGSLINRELLDVQADSQGGFWPAGFRHRPDTGEKLPPHTPQWAARGKALGPDGLPSVASLGSIDSSSGEVMDNVPAGIRFFGTGGTPARVIALNPDDGRLYWYAPLSKRWILIDRCPLRGVAVPFSFGMAGNAEGVFFAANDQLIHVLPAQQPKFDAIKLPGTTFAPVAILGSAIAAPVRTTAGAVIALFKHGQFIKVPVEGDLGPDVVFSSPIMKEEASQCFWQGTSGYIVYEDDVSGPKARFCPWSNGEIGLPFLRPWRAKTGALWAKVKLGPDGQAGIYPMATAGRAQRSQPLQAPCVSAGSAVFRGRERSDNPTGNPLEELNLGFGYDGNLVVPLLRMESGQTLVGLVGGSDAAGWRGFLLREGKSGIKPMAIALHTDGGKLEMLGHTINISTTDEIELFFCGDRLFIHHYESGTCKGWQFSSVR
jgi:TerD domain